MSIQGTIMENGVLAHKPTAPFLKAVLKIHGAPVDYKSPLEIGPSWARTLSPLPS